MNEKAKSDLMNKIYFILFFIMSSPGDNTTRDTNYTATCLPSRKLHKLDEPDTQDTVEKQGRARKCCTPMNPHI